MTKNKQGDGNLDNRAQSRQLLQKRGLQLEEILLVLVEEEIAGLSFPGMSVWTLFNPFYGLTDNLATCWLARLTLSFLRSHSIRPSLRRMIRCA